MSEPIHSAAAAPKPSLRLVVLWIDWYAYHVARFEGLLANPDLSGRVRGVEFVGGVGVHAGLKFREELPAHLPIDTLLPETSWQDVDQVKLSRKVWQQLTQLDPAAVLVPGYYTLPAITAAVWARAHHRTSILMTESTAFDHVRVPWKEAVKSFLLRLLFDAAVVGGRAHLRYLDQLNFPMDHVARAYDVVDNASLAQAVAELRTNDPVSSALPDRPYFLYVGRLAPEKNVETLLSAWVAYRETGGTWPLILVGDGPSAGALREQANNSGFAAEVHFPGLRASRELPRFYAFAGCFVLPSLREPWGLVVNEALACSLPVLVSSRCGCAEDLVDEGRNGYTFDPSSTSELTGRLLHMSMLFPEVRKSMGKASEHLIAAYTPQRFGQEIARVLSESGRGVYDPASSLVLKNEL